MERSKEETKIDIKISAEAARICTAIAELQVYVNKVGLCHNNTHEILNVRKMVNMIMKKEEVKIKGEEND